MIGKTRKPMNTTKCVCAVTPTEEGGVRLTPVGGEWAAAPAESSAFQASVVGLVLVPWVGHCGSAATLPTDPHPAVKFVKINRPGQHQQARGYEFLALPCGACEPVTGDGSGALYANIVAALRHLTEMIN
jgi:hypothetical protein